MVSRASVEDADTVLALQRIAYLSEAEIYDDPSIPPLTQTLDELKSDFGARIFLKTTTDDKIVGSVRAYQDGQTCYVERLIVHPDFQGRGIGTRLMKEVEALYPDAERFELFTGHESEGNIRLYRRLGYEVFREEPVTERLTFVFMEKVV